MRRTVAALVALALLGAGIILAARHGFGLGPEEEPGAAGQGDLVRTPEYRRAKSLGRIDEPGLTELSGIVSSNLDEDHMWVHNDSGAGPFIYCVDRGAELCGTWLVQGADSVDWEDIARGPGPGARGYLYVGDIGDNAGARNDIVVYRFPEPDADLPSGVVHTTARAEAFHFRYPGSPRDAETLLVDPATGDLYVVTKGARAVVFEAEAPLRDDTTLQRRGSLGGLGFLPGPTGGDISPDGSRIVLATYTGAYEFKVGSGGVAEALAERPLWIRLPAAQQREAIAYSRGGRAIVTTSEGRRPALFEAVRRPSKRQGTSK